MLSRTLFSDLVIRQYQISRSRRSADLHYFGRHQICFHVTDLVRHVVIFVILLFAILSVYATSDEIGSPGKIWGRRNEISLTMPSTGEGGSYVTMYNSTALLTGIIIMFSGFSV
jgi:hypothetical protein